MPWPPAISLAAYRPCSRGRFLWRASAAQCSQKMTAGRSQLQCSRGSLPRRRRTITPSMPAAIDRRRLREEARQDVIADGVVLLMERGVRYAGHDGELLVRIGQLRE